jgi:hypothetical protein
VYAKTLGTRTAVGRRELKLKGRHGLNEVTKIHQKFSVAGRRNNEERRNF